MSLHNIYIVGLATVLLVRLLEIGKVWNIAKFHGEEWCFDAPVSPGFYSTPPGSNLLRAFHGRLAAWFGVELAVTAILYAFAGSGWAFWTLCCTSASSALHTAATAKRFAREAWKHALPDRAPAPSRLVADLAPRTVHSYDLPVLRWALRAGTAAALAILMAGWWRAAHAVNWMVLAGIPAVALYLQAGLLLIRRMVAEWRVCRIPASCPEPALEWRDEARAFHIFAVEIVRAWTVLLLLVAAVRGAFPAMPLAKPAFLQLLVLLLVAASIVLLRYRRRRFVAAAQRLRGLTSRPSDAGLPSRNFHLAGLVYHDSEHPAAFVRRGNFFAINLAHPCSRLLVAWLGGWLLIIGLVWRIS